MSRTARVIGAAVIPALSVPLVATTARADVPAPPTNPRLPKALDIASPYVEQTVCDPPAKPGVAAFARLMANHYSEYNYGISRNCNAGLTEHSEGRALDWMLNAYDAHEREVAESVLAWLLAPDAEGRPAAMARRFGIMYIIWDRKIWGSYNMSAGWRPYYGSSPHTDHIHFSFSWDGAMSRTSWWSGKAWTGSTRGPGGPTVSVPTQPEQTSSTFPTLRLGSSGPDVKLAQQVIGTQADGEFGPATQSALATWQRANGVAVTRVVDTATWSRMVALGKVPARGAIDGGLMKHAKRTLRLGSTGTPVRDLQKALGGVTADGAFGSRTETAVKAFQKKKGLKVTGVVTENDWRALANLPYTKVSTTSAPKPAPSSSAIPARVRLGSTGAAVKLLQEKLGGLTVDGAFGPATEAALKKYQERRSLLVTGRVTTNDWKALLGRPYRKSGLTPTVAKPKPKPTPVRTVSTSTPYTPVKSTVLAKGARGSAVKVLQRGLRSVAVDGVFGSGTEAAVKAFQRSAKLPTTGIVDARTWNALEARDNPLLAYRSVVLKKGSTGAPVRVLQELLGITVDGQYGSQTEAAVKAFQRKNKLTSTGYVTSVTWEALEKQRR